MDFTTLFKPQVLQAIHNVLMYTMTVTLLLALISMFFTIRYYNPDAEVVASNKFLSYMKRQGSMLLTLLLFGLIFTQGVIAKFISLQLPDYSIPTPQITNSVLDETCYGLYDKYLDAYAAYEEQLKTASDTSKNSSGSNVYVAGLRKFVSQPHKKIRESVCVGNTNQYALQVEIDHLHADTDAMKDLMKHLD